MINSLLNFYFIRLRNLPLTSSGGLNITSPPRSPVFAEIESGKIVYNKEELIKYYKKVKDIPPALENCSVLLHPEPLLPMTMIPLSEDEQRNANSVNSTVALRMTGRGSSHPRGRGSVRGRGNLFIVIVYIVKVDQIFKS